MTQPSIDLAALALRFVTLQHDEALKAGRDSTFCASPELDTYQIGHKFDIVGATSGNLIDPNAVVVLIDGVGGVQVDIWREAHSPTTVFRGSLASVLRLMQIEAELQSLGYRMAHSLSALDNEGHAIVEIASGETVEESGLPARVIELATEWSRLEGVEDEQRNDAAPAAAEAAVPEKLSDEELERRVQELVDRGLTFGNCINVLGESRDENPYAVAAKENYGDDDLEFDDKLVVSESDDGAFVMAWRWVGSNELPKAHDFEEGDEVWWFDPDREISSGIYEVDEADHPEIITISNEAGSTAEVPCHELVLIDRDVVAEWAGQHYKVNFDAEPDDRQVEWIGRWAQAQRDAKLAEAA